MSLHIESIPAPPLDQSFRLLRWRENLKDVDYCDAGGKTTPVEGAGDHWHLHKELELTWIESGQGTRVVGDNIAQFSGPELVLIGSQLPHCWHGLQRSSGLAIQFYWPIDHPIRSLPEFKTLMPLWERSGNGLLFPPQIARTIAPLLEAMLPANSPLRLGLLLEILGTLAAVPSETVLSLSQQDFSLQKGTRHQPGIQRVIQNALAHYAEPFSMTQVLQLAGMSKATFARQFPRFTGLTYTEFLLHLRLDHARQHLISSDDTISSIAFEAGFNHLSHFNRAYRERFGKTPTQERPHSP
ncbi:MAG: AraC family transcriptional regulator [Verrucomicrobiota bacterium]